MSSVVYDKFEYVSVEATIRTLMKNVNYVRAVTSVDEHSGLITGYRDGIRFKKHALFSNPQKTSLSIQLFYDGMGTANPLRGQSTMHNIGVFYYVVENLPLLFNSCHANVHLLAICYSADLKVYGFDPILDKFTAEMKQLSTTGINGDFPLLGECTIYVNLGQVCCDNLALNGIFGFIESFSVDYFCTLCFATQSDIQVKFYENEFQMRTVMEYETDVSMLPKLHGKVHSRGVKKRCKLNDISGFHVVSNYGLDIMHIILEGTAPLELGCILHSLIEQKCFTLSDVNERVEYFWSMVTVDRKIKPPFINKVEMGARVSPSMKAMQYWSLLKYLPIIMGDKVESDVQDWHVLLSLSHLVDLLFAPRFTAGMVDYLRDVIADHLNLFKHVYGNLVSLKPKHHLLVHLPTIINQNGPLVGMNCLRYEMKNSFMKRCANNVCNFRNICHSLAYRHQQNTLYSKLCGNNLRDYVVVGTHEAAVCCQLECCDAVCEKFKSEPSDELYVARTLNFANTQYDKNQHIIVDVNADGLPEFGKIDLFVCLPADMNWYIVVKCFKTTSFEYHYHSYCVEQVMPAQYRILAPTELVDHRPVSAFSKLVDTVSRTYRELIRLHYHVIKL